jgi:hypothetical protein
MAITLLQRDGINDGMSNPRGMLLIIVTTIFVALSTTMVVARLVTRWSITKPAGADDYVIAVAAVCRISRSCLNGVIDIRCPR